MSSATTTDVIDPPLDGAVDLPREVLPSGRWHLLVRLALLVPLLVAVVGAALQPVQRSVDDLLSALAAVEVAAVTLERPTAPGEAGTYAVRWSGDGRPATGTYTVRFAGDQGTDDPGEDEGRDVLAAAAASPRDVEVVTVDRMPPTGLMLPGSVTVAALPVAAWAVGFVVALAAGPEPRLATRWAWFWLWGAAWPVALAYLVLEPTPLWSRRTLVAPRSRLTGGWAFLLGLLLGPFVLGLVTGA
ncbi:hypothetical protein [Cellulomonas triticagri]|uniref:Uncharacterized protein n=1 Tax=Cellulomonas triticagri TaxID=2483352 RepID=A0A3M2JUF9_9CELL|nr:hypothetical protein [Cellulomonas triticagri]RMI13798.1 hypothetical protein EBM89_02880 [Cellulomonas triticagri]